MNKKSGKIIFWVAAVVSCILAGFLTGYFLGEILPADAGIAQKVVALFLLFLNVAGVYFVQMGLVTAGDMLWQKMNSIKKMKTGRVQFVWQLGINIVVIIAFFLAAVCTENDILKMESVIVIITGVVVIVKKGVNRQSLT